MPRPRPHHARLRFDRLPAAYCHPERLGRLLPDGLPATFCDRMQGSPRLRLRLSAVLARRFALEPLTADDLASPEGHFAQLEGEALNAAIRRAGAIWHARSIRKIILAEPLKALIERLGRDNHRAALRFIDLAHPDDADPDHGEAEAPNIERLMQRIERDGLIAVNAWCRHQPDALAARLRLKLPPGPEADDEPPASHRHRGPIIVDRVASALHQDADATADDHG